jgi:hypothetical protein
VAPDIPITYQELFVNNKCTLSPIASKVIVVPPAKFVGVRVPAPPAVAI